MQFAYTSNVFINCPFDETYQAIFQSIIFTVIDCGYTPRCSLEIEDSSEVRIDKIAKVIADCKYGIHDISRTELDKNTNLPRFNMPLELGMFLGAKRFGDDEQGKKVCLILDKDHFRYQSFISDIAGQDIQSHKNDDSEVIKVIRNWLRSLSGRVTIPGGKEILRRYRNFDRKKGTGQFLMNCAYKPHKPLAFTSSSMFSNVPAKIELRGDIVPFDAVIFCMPQPNQLNPSPRTHLPALPHWYKIHRRSLTAHHIFAHTSLNLH